LGSQGRLRLVQYGLGTLCVGREEVSRTPSHRLGIARAERNCDAISSREPRQLDAAGPRWDSLGRGRIPRVQVHPVLFHLGGWSVRGYGLLLVLGFLAGLALALRRASKYGIERRRIVHVFALVLVSAVVGARALYVAEHAAAYVGGPWRVLRVSEGGLSMYGGAVLAAIVLLGYARRSGIPFVALGALLAAPLALGEAITRVGCFLNGCCFGVQCRRPWCVVFPPESAAGLAWPGVPLHPTQLYTAGASLVVFALLVAAERKNARPGLVLGGFLVLHGGMRLVLESYRHHASTTFTLAIAGATYGSAEIVSVASVALGCAILWRSAMRAGEGRQLTGGALWRRSP
jgi:phosphatidylglycerol:prolipoprotein diacylglycerol transferase